MAVRHKGESFIADGRRTGFVGTPADELVMDWGEDLELIVVRVELSELSRLAARMLTAEDAEPERLTFDPVLDSPAATSAIISQATLLEQLVGAAEAGAVNPLGRGASAGRGDGHAAPRARQHLARGPDHPPARPGAAIARPPGRRAHGRVRRRSAQHRARRPGGRTLDPRAP
jgi:hypothetical protein